MPTVSAAPRPPVSPLLERPALPESPPRLLSERQPIEGAPPDASMGRPAERPAEQSAHLESAPLARLRPAEPVESAPPGAPAERHVAPPETPAVIQPRATPSAEGPSALPETPGVIQPRAEPPGPPPGRPLTPATDVPLQSQDIRREPILVTTPRPQPAGIPLERPLPTVSAAPRPPADAAPPLVEAPRPVVRRTVDVRIGSVELRVQHPKPPEPPGAPQERNAPVERPRGLDEYTARRSYRGDDL